MRTARPLADTGSPLTIDSIRASVIRSGRARSEAYRGERARVYALLVHCKVTLGGVTSRTDRSPPPRCVPCAPPSTCAGNRRRYPYHVRGWSCTEGGAALRGCTAPNRPARSACRARAATTFFWVVSFLCGFCCWCCGVFCFFSVFVFVLLC